MGGKNSKKSRISSITIGAIQYYSSRCVPDTAPLLEFRHKILTKVYIIALDYCKILKLYVNIASK